MSASGDEPQCFQKQKRPIVDQVSSLDDEQVFRRLVFAEGISVNVESLAECQDLRDPVMETIAFGVMNRVRLARRKKALARRYGTGVRGVIFKPGQFNPAISLRSKFSTYFLCPSQAPAWRVYWRGASSAVVQATKGEENPFIQTEWEKKEKLSLVNQFYYPLSEQATEVPPKWTKKQNMVKPLKVGGRVIPEKCIWFFRNEKEW